MKKSFILFPVFIFILIAASAQKPMEPYQYGHWLSPEEMHLKLHPETFVETPPPSAPVRNLAEFDQMQGALVRYPFGIPLTIVQELAKDVMVTTIVANTTQQATVTSLYQGAGVNMNHCNFLLAPTDSYWTRDYGPWFESDSSNKVGIIDFPYNRPRPNDDEIPKLVAAMLGIPWFGMNVTHTGGNYMSDGMGIAASTNLVWTENPTLTHDQIAQKVHDYLGIENYQVVPDPNINTPIDHIDCWGKFLAPDKILIRKTPSSNVCYTALENMANYWLSQVCSYGYPYKVYRVYTPNDEPYSNSLILNKKVFLPYMNTNWDDSAKAVYEAAMPGYEVLGFIAAPGYAWLNTDALHCRVMGIGDIGILYIRHIPLSGNQPAQDNFKIDADIVPCSDSAVYNDSVLICYKVNNGNYNTIKMTNTSGIHYTGLIPKQPSGSIIKYYLYAADKSGRHAMAPYIGPADPFMFTSVYTDLTAIPDTLWFRTADDCLHGKVTHIHNFTTSQINLLNVQQSGSSGWRVDSMSVTTFPYMMNPNDSAYIHVIVDLPVETGIPGYFIDTMKFVSAIDTHRVIIVVNDSLLTGIHNAGNLQHAFLGTNYPNPFNDMTMIPFNPGIGGHVVLEILSLQGNRLKTLVNSVQSAGLKTVPWDGTSDNGNIIPPGIYLYRLITEHTIQTKRIILIR
jgi:agmatine deiminase